MRVGAKVVGGGVLGIRRHALARGDAALVSLVGHLGEIEPERRERDLVRRVLVGLAAGVGSHGERPRGDERHALGRRRLPRAGRRGCARRRQRAGDGARRRRGARGKWSARHGLERAGVAGISGRASGERERAGRGEEPASPRHRRHPASARPIRSTAATNASTCSARVAWLTMHTRSTTRPSSRVGER